MAWRGVVAEELQRMVGIVVTFIIGLSKRLAEARLVGYGVTWLVVS